MKLRKMFIDFEREFINTWAEYKKLMDEIDLYRGKDLDEETVKRVNELLHGIQEAYNELLPTFTFIGERFKFANNAMYQYNRFIDQLKQSGATEYPSDGVA